MKAQIKSKEKFLSLLPQQTLFLGVAAASVSLFVFSPSVWTLLVLVWSVLRILKLAKNEQLAALVVAFFMLFLSINFENTAKENMTFIENHSNLQNEKIYILEDTIKVNGDLMQCISTYKQKKVQTFLTIESEEEKQYWENVTKRVELEISGDLNIGEGKRNLGGFDTRLSMKVKGIAGILNVEQVSSRKELSDISFRRLRRKAIVHVNQSFSSPLKDYINGLLFAYFSKDFEEEREHFQSMGVLHLLAISGMHIGFYLSGFRMIVLRMGVTKEKMIIIQLLFSILIFGLTGGATSVVRCLLTRNFQEGSRHTSVKLNGQNAFGLALCIHLFFSPMLLYTVAGQLSYALGFIILFLKPALKDFHGIRKEIFITLFLSLSILPLLALNFYEWNPFSILWTVVLTRVFQLFLLPFVLCCFILSFLIQPKGVEFLGQWMQQIFQFCSEWTKGNWSIGCPSTIVFLLFLALSVLLLLFVEMKKWKSCVKVFIGMCLVVFLQTHPPVGLVAMVDVGQGDCLFIQRPFSRKATLIDVGGEVRWQREKWQERKLKSLSEKTLLPFLKYRGVREIETLVVSHPHDDHFGEMVNLSKKVPIRQVIYLKGSDASGKFASSLKVLQRKGVKCTPILPPMILGNLEFLAPNKESKTQGNNDSLICKYTVNGIKFLFVGDAEKEEEDEILTLGEKLKADVLKVGHHGSKTSSSNSFIQAVQPQIALISCGKNNRMAHPNQETIDMLESQKIEYYRTDKNGMIIFEIYPLIQRVGKVRTVLK